MSKKAVEKAFASIERKVRRSNEALALRDPRFKMQVKLPEENVFQFVDRKMREAGFEYIGGDEVTQVIERPRTKIKLSISGFDYSERLVQFNVRVDASLNAPCEYTIAVRYIRGAGDPDPEWAMAACASRRTVYPVTLEMDGRPVLDAAGRFTEAYVEKDINEQDVYGFVITGLYEVRS